MPIAAGEVRGYQLLRVLEIDVSDPHALVTNTGWWTSPKTLYLSDQHSLRDSTSTADPDYIPCVMDWGQISQRAYMETGLQATGDLSLTLSNAHIRAQVTQPPGAAALSSVPQPDELRLSDLMRHYEFMHAAVRVKLVFIAKGTHDQSVAGAVNLITVFKGFIRGVAVDPDAINLDFTHDILQKTSPIVVRKIVDPPFSEGKNLRVPVCYGSTKDRSTTFDPEPLTIIRGKGNGFPVLPYSRTGEDFSLVFNDYVGVNTGFTSQSDYALTDAFLFAHNQDSESVSMLRRGAATQGKWDDANTTSEGLLLVDNYLTARTFLHGYRVKNSTGLTDPEKTIDKNHTTYGTFAVDNTANYIEWNVVNSSNLGTIYGTDGVVAWIALTGLLTVNASCTVSLGVWQSGGAAVGTAAILNNVDLASASRIITQTGEIIGSSPAYSGTVGTITYVQLGTEMNKWHWEHGGVEAVVRFDVLTAASAGQVVRIVGAGFMALHDWRKVVATARPGRPLYPITRASWEQKSLGPALFLQDDRSMLDTSTGTITGTNDKVLTNAAEIAAHVIAKWATGVVSTDLNLVGTGTTDTTAFGSFRHAAAGCDAWLDDVTGASAFTYDIACWETEPGTVEEWIGKICAQAPMMIYKGNDGIYRAVVYPNGTPNNALRFKRSDGTTNVDFHPGIEGTSTYGQPYAFSQLRCDFTTEDEVANDFIVRFRFLGCSNELNLAVNVNKDGYSIWSETAGGYVTASDTLGDYLSSLCDDSETRYGGRLTRVVDCPWINSEATATAYLQYLVRRYSRRRMLVSAVVCLEGYDLLPGHVVTFSDLTNRYMTMPEYSSFDWNDYYFQVSEVSHVSTEGSYMVSFKAERVYNAADDPPGGN